MAKKRKKAANNEGSMSYDKKRKQFTYRITYLDHIDNKKKRKTFYGQSEKICKNKADEFLKIKARNLSKEKEEITVADILEDFYTLKHNLNRITDSTYLRKKYTLDIYRKSNIAKIPIVKMNVNDIKIFLSSQKNKSNSDIDKIYSSLNAAFELVISENIIDKNPLNDKTVLKPKSNKPDKKVRGFTQEEQQKFLETLKDYKPIANKNYYKPQFLISLMTGMRMGEINALTLNDINLDNKEIHIYKTITKDTNGKAKLGAATKTIAGQRIIPIPESLIPILKNVIDNYIPNENNLLFVNKSNGGVISTGQVNCAFKRLCEKANLEVDGQHMLRHSYATRCIEAGISAPVLKTYLGHTDISTTINTYVDIFNKFQKEELKKYEEYMKDNFDMSSI